MPSILLLIWSKNLGTKKHKIQIVEAVLQPPACFKPGKRGHLQKQCGQSDRNPPLKYAQSIAGVFPRPASVVVNFIKKVIQFWQWKNETQGHCRRHKSALLHPQLGSPESPPLYCLPAAGSTASCSHSWSPRFRPFETFHLVPPLTSRQ